MSTLSQPTPRLGSLLLERGYLSAESLEKALERQLDGSRSKLLGEILVDQGICSEDQVVECLATEYGVPYAKLEARLYDPGVTEILAREYIEHNTVLPLFLVRDTLTVAVPEPSNLFLISEIGNLTRKHVQIVAASAK
ncbi:MAG: type II/IV secretion system protein, partial [Planctomycetes bacterium]|nr:type II/IV secretion system protein [Planctomycetota bacterium]